MPATNQQFEAAIAPWAKDGTILKRLFNSYGDTAVFLVRYGTGSTARYDYVRAFTVGETINVSVDHVKLMAEELLCELFDLPTGCKSGDDL